MKKKFIYIGLILGSLSILNQSCNDDFLRVNPETDMSQETSLKTESELTIYLNGLYGSYITGHQNDWAYEKLQPAFLSGSHLLASDFMTDNMVRRGNIPSMLDNTFASPNDGSAVGWTWGNLRKINYFLENYNKALPSVGNEITKLDKYAAEALFFKAMDYYRKLLIFGDVPWFSNYMNVDSEDLYKPRDKRTLVADSLLNTINQSFTKFTENIGNPHGRINKDMAAFLKARIGLFEGSFRTYHSELQLQSTAKPFLEACVEACEYLINSGRYELYNKGTNPYWKLFTFKLDPKTDGNKEAILARTYDGTQSGHATQRYWDQNNNVSDRPAGGATRSLVDEYLCEDGRPIYIAGTEGNYTLNPLFKGYDGMWTELENRDPRLKQTINYPGESRSLYNRNDGTLSKDLNGVTYPRLSYNNQNSSVTGYLMMKHWMGDRPEQEATQKGQQTAIEFRYGEVLLMLAEAKAILGTLTQEDLDKTINKLRERAGYDFVKYPSSKLTLGVIPADPRLDKIYSEKLDYVVTPIIREIRRERRIEMVLEDRRYEDLIRWKAGKLMTIPMRGIKFTEEKKTLYNGSNLTKPIIALKEEVNKDIFLDKDGFIIAYPRSSTITLGTLPWEDYRYYWPLPLYDLSLEGSQLVQNPGWLGGK